MELEVFSFRKDSDVKYNWILTSRGDEVTRDSLSMNTLDTLDKILNRTSRITAQDPQVILAFHRQLEKLSPEVASKFMTIQKISHKDTISKKGWTWRRR
jgi:hypothetical protein